MVRVVSGIKKNPIPMPRTTLGQITVAKSALRVKFDMRYVAYAFTTIPKERSPLGLTFVTSLPAIGNDIRVAMPPGPRTNPAR